MSECKVILTALVLPLLLAIPLIYPTRKQILAHDEMSSIKITDRNGNLLREILSEQDATSHYCPLDQISPWLIRATLASEDKRFFLHKGIDPIAIIRSVIENIKYHDVVSGGSTITQQLARNLLHSPSRSIVYKLIEAFFAFNLELKLNKSEILELYFNYAPYGNQTYGIEAASYLYYRKPSRDLSLNEAAYLTSIPKAPSYFNPYRYPDRMAKEQVKILTTMFDNGDIDSTTYQMSVNQPLNIISKEKNFLAPHFCEFIIRYLGHKNIESVKTTLDLQLQTETEEILKNNVRRLDKANVTNAAAIIFDNQTMEILAYVGSVDFFDPLISGEVDGVQSLRQPGSALKPFTYAIALENGATAATLIPDLPTYEATFGGDYTPKNYDEKYHGMVRLRTALACSYNIPAVRVCGEFGPEMLLTRLKTIGFSSLDKSPVYYGLGLTLGNGEVTLLELTRAFSVFSHYGFYIKEKTLINVDTMKYMRKERGKKTFTPEIAYIIMDILADNNARSPAFGEYSPLNLPFFCAAKTGTSKNFRDNWCVGFTDKYLIGIWVGNFDGRSMHHVSGITGAGPIFRDIVLMLHRKESVTEFIQPQKIKHCTICAKCGCLAQDYSENTIDEIFCAGTEPPTYCQCHLKQSPSVIDYQGFMQSSTKKENFVISCPDDGDIFKIDPILRIEYQVLKFRVQSARRFKEVTWSVDGEVIGTTIFPYTINWQLSPGNHKITAYGVFENEGQVASPPVSILVLK
jgi:penicillin-binding protein 1C